MIYIHDIYIYMCVCVCVCICVKFLLTACVQFPVTNPLYSKIVLGRQNWEIQRRLRCNIVVSLSVHTSRCRYIGIQFNLHTHTHTYIYIERERERKSERERERDRR